MILGRRSAIISLLLLIAFGISVALTWQATKSAREHRVAAERVVQDYAAVVADDVLHRTTFEVETFGLIPLRSILLTTLIDHNRLLSAADLAKSPRPLIQSAADLVDTTFVADFEKRTVTPSLPPMLQQWVLSDLERSIHDRIDGDRHFQIHIRLADGDHFLVFAATPVSPRRYVAFTLRPETFVKYTQRAFERRTAFPGQWITTSHLTKRDLYIRMTNCGRELLRSGDHYEPALGVRFIVPQIYGDLLAGTAVETSFTAAALPQIVAGGLPRSNLSIALLMLLTSMFVLAAIGMLVSRERQLDVMRSDFISAVSHELRTPLTHIRMFSETLAMNRVRSDAERQRALQIVTQETTRLGHLVDNILLLSRRERGMLALSLQEIDVREVIGETVHAFEPMLRASKARIAVDAPASVIALVDRGALKQVLINFLDNAVKYGPSGQTITVSLTQLTDRFRIDVDDQGPGIPSGERDSIWQKFFRLPRDRESDKAGSGIGLAVSADIVERHGGRYWTAAAPTGGSRFSIELPSRREADAAARDDDGRFLEQLESRTGH